MIYFSFLFPQHYNYRAKRVEAGAEGPRTLETAWHARARPREPLVVGVRSKLLGRVEERGERVDRPIISLLE